MVNVNVKWGKNSYDVEINTEEPVAVFKIQLWTLTGVPVERQKIMGVKGGLLKDDANWAALGMKDGQKLQLVGTAEGGELKGPAEKTVFVEDLTPAEKARILKEKLAEPMPVGLVNLGNTCYMNAVVQFLKPAKEFTSALSKMPGSAGTTTDPDGKVTASFKEVYRMLENSGEAVPPFGAVQYLRERFPQFAQRAKSGQGFAQQDAEEVLNCLLMTFATQMKEGNKSAIDRMFGFNIKAKYKCIESEAEGEEEKEENARKLCCFLGNQLQPVDHLHQGIKLGLEETIEKTSPSLGRMAHYAKVGRIDSLPDYFVVHFVRFEWKKAHELARTDAGKTKMCRKVSFPQKMDIYEFCTESLKKKLRVARIVQAERAEREASLRNEEKTKTAGEKKEGGDVTMGDASASGEKKEEGDKMEVDAQGAASSSGFKPGQPIDNGHFELVSIVTHQGRAADSGHYIGWSKRSDDEWLKFDDDKVSSVKWAQIQELQGGLFDFHIAYLLLFKKLTVTPTAEELKEAESGHVKPSVVLAAEGSAANNKDNAGSSKDGMQL